MSSLNARVGFATEGAGCGLSATPFGATAGESFSRSPGPLLNGLKSRLCGPIGSCDCSSAYGSSKSLLGLKRLPLSSTSHLKPTDEPGCQLGSKVKFGPHAR